MRPQPTWSAIARCLAVLVAGGAVWLWLGPYLNPLIAAFLQSTLGLVHGQALAGVSAHGNELVLQTNLISPENGALLGARVQPAHFTLAMPLVWAAIVALAPPRAWPFWLPVATILAFAFFLTALALQAGVALPRLGLRAGVDMLQGGTPLEPRRLPWRAPDADVLSAIEWLRIALVHFNLFVLPPLLAVLAWRSAASRGAPVTTHPAQHAARRKRRR